jgi:hypothetical protein
MRTGEAAAPEPIRAVAAQPVPKDDKEDPMKAIIVAAVLALAAGPAFAQAPADYVKRVTDSYRSAFAAYERNGVVTRDAVRGDLVFGPWFDAIDINRDGVITREELDRFLANLPPAAA